MKFIDSEVLARLKHAYPPGTIVELIEMDDVHAPPPHTLGVVQAVDDAGSILVKWENDSTLSLIYGVDKFIIHQID